MGHLTGARVVAVWIIWAVLVGALRGVTENVGIALPISTSTVVTLSRFLGPLLLLVFFAPPLLMTFVWWRRRRSGAQPPS